MEDISALYSSLLAADEARDAAALAAAAWQTYGQLATTAAELGALRARFRVYAASPHASGASQRQAAGRTGSPDRRLRSGCVAGRRGPTGDVIDDEKTDRAAPVPAGLADAVVNPAKAVVGHIVTAAGTG
jgi:hypothetical protein